MRLFFWRNRSKVTPVPSSSEAVNNVNEPETPQTPPPSSQETEVPVAHNPYVGKKFGDLIEDIVSEHTRMGGFDDLQGKGQSLNLDGNIHENHYLYKTMKNANVLPPWLELQHEIRNEIAALLKMMERGQVESLDERLSGINRKISRYNEQCPSTLLQKPKLTQQNVYQQYDKWE